ncbi:MAG: T9SS type A sorting domain-containing protein [Bacteroidia bacterium]|nr:T9SS type A sorting domain-containing protein [Bacteroidia bacterium]
MKRILKTLSLSILLLSSVIAQVNITFEVNTATLGTVSSEGLFIAGGNGFGLPGDNRLSDPDGDGVYTITLQKEKGFSSFFIFLNGNCADCSCKEKLAGLLCSDPKNFDDRFLPPIMSDTTIKACFNTCDNDGSCTIINDSVDITFELNTSEIEVDPGGLFLAGGSGFGVAGDNPMIDPEDDGIYTVTVRRAKGFLSYYTFLNGNCGDWSCKENIEGQPCADPDAFNDRFIQSVMNDTIIKTCFAKCSNDGSCETAYIGKLKTDKNLFSIRPTLVNDYINIQYNHELVSMNKEIKVVNSSGQVFEKFISKNQAKTQLNTLLYTSGVYFITIQSTNKILTRKFIVQK